MNRLSGIPTLNAGAQDLRLTGEHNRGSYVQRRRAQMAGGGITNARQGYFLGGVTDFISDLIPNELKDPKVAIPLALASTKLLPEGMGKGWLGTGLETLGTKVPMLEPVTDIMQTAGEKISGIPGSIMEAFTGPNVVNEELERVIGSPGKPHGTEAGGDLMKIITQAAQSPGFKLTDPSTWLGGITGAAGKVFGTGDDQWGKYTIPMGIGAAMGKLQQDYLDKQPPFPADETGFDVGETQRLARITPEAEAAAKGLFFTPQDKYRLRSPEQEQAILGAAEGGRIGYEHGGRHLFSPSTWFEGGPESETNPTLFGTQNSLMNKAAIGQLKNAVRAYEAQKIMGELDPDQQADYDLKIKQLEALEQGAQGKAQGGRIGYDNGGIGQLMPRRGRVMYPGGYAGDDDYKGISWNDFVNDPGIDIKDTDIDDAIRLGLTTKQVYHRWLDRRTNRLGNKAQGGRIGYAGGADYYANLYSKYAQEMIQAGNTPMDIEDFVAMIKEQEKENKAQGGRIGYRDAGEVTDEMKKEMLEAEPAGNWRKSPLEIPDDWLKEFIKKLKKPTRTGAQEGGLMDLGGMEKDYREEGGFVPIGGQERADDVPARLSKNEFVFTADAVRAAGGGDIDRGAEIMENLMDNLEAGGKVSEESQGLEGARNMFANAQQLEKRII